jgi:hypothetical protein
VWGLPLERDGGSPGGCQCSRFDVSLRLFAHGPFFALGCAMWGVICSCGFGHLFLEMGDFPCY